MKLSTTLLLVPLIVCGASSATYAQNTRGSSTATDTTRKPAKPAKPAQNPYLQASRYLIAAGDLNGDHGDEVVTWENKTKELTVWKYVSGQLAKVTSHTLTDYPTALTIGDVDGDGKAELLVGEGIASTDSTNPSASSVRLRIYHPLESTGWAPVDVYQSATARPDIASMKVTQVGSDKSPAILFNYYTSKYYVDVAVARHGASGWSVEKLKNTRMGTTVAVGDIYGGSGTNVIVGRVYGDPIVTIDPETHKSVSKFVPGDAFVLAGMDKKNDSLPVYRGVSSLATGDVGDGRQTSIIVGDGWHQDYGKLARARLATIRRVDGAWKYNLIEDIPGFINVTKISPVDINHDGKDEIVVFAGTTKGFGGAVRIYQNSATGWRGATLSDSSDGFTVADLKGDSKREVVFAGADPRVMPLAVDQIKWSSKLAAAKTTYLADPDSLNGNPAPELVAKEWVGNPETLASLRGKVVLLDFWATWCGPCIKAFPTLKNWLKQYGPEGFTIIGVTNNSDQTTEDVRQFLKKHPLDWPVAIDPDSRPQMAYGSQDLPHQVLIDRKGVVRAYYVGSGERLPALETNLKKLLAEK